MSMPCWLLEDIVEFHLLLVGIHKLIDAVISLLNAERIVLVQGNDLIEQVNLHK